MYSPVITSIYSVSISYRANFQNRKYRKEIGKLNPIDHYLTAITLLFLVENFFILKPYILGIYLFSSLSHSLSRS
ncbi:hypothetical protein Lepto1489_22845 (plasmid) [Leptospira interrogans serovar Bataviae]|uniref:Uncharacterized protein n=1 Tax=Leptospira interrogans serovar Bataviae TaxID=312175 RepID=A0AAP9WPI9_LEPIR|nr:hypothetical protein Lepto1489_22845 [Leptospira interrogans serovar Bataviae]